ncbi:MAG: hypothetical protein Q8K98_07755 [Bacteroidota bacterium]|nr:hypothetical protein [Bacteroidota bacterium]
MQRYLFLIILIIPLLSACDNDKYGSFDISLSVPFISQAKLAYYNIDSDTIKPGNQFSLADTITIQNRVSAHISDKDGLIDLKNVKFIIYLPESNKPVSQGYLYDNGQEADSIAGDGIFSGVISFKISRVIVGNFIVELQAEDKSQLLSNVFSTSFRISRMGKPPIIFDLKAPENTTLPTLGEKVILMSVAAFDTNGYNDIKEVYFRSLDSSDPTRKFFLLDNGNISTSGDSIANDGIFSILVKLPFNMTPKSYRFEFEAKDYTELLSNKILHTLTVTQP